MNIAGWFAAGVLAGLALAVPLGGIGLLLLREGSLHGTRRALPAAAAVAAVDTIYCIVAVTVGAATVPVLTRLTPWPEIVGGTVLVVMGGVGFRKGLRPAEDAPDMPGSGRRWTTFFLLTLINPATLVYFAAVTTGLGEVAADAGSAAAFVVGVGLSSWAWQSLLVAVGGLLGRVTTARSRRITGLAGSALVGVLGAGLVVHALG